MTMSSKRTHRKIERTPEDKKRIEDVRQRFQAARPAPGELLASGDVSEFVPLGEYVDIREAVRALKQQRERKGLSLAVVAQRAKMDKAAISRLENGLQANPTVGTLCRYAAAIDAQIVWSVRDARPKRILIEFLGGDWDGKTIDSQSSDETERMHVHTCLHLTRNGTVGRSFHGASMQMSDMLKKGECSLNDWKPVGGETHKYTVVERLEEHDEVLIRMKCSVRERHRAPD